MDRCALFVDAGYLLADGAMAVHGTRRRDAVSWDYSRLLELLNKLAIERTQLPLLRCYWYEATPEGRRAAEHDALADVPGLKLRLGRVRPGRREGVDLMAYRDLTTLAREHAICDAVLVSGDEDMVHAVTDAQDHGVRVVGVHVAVDGNWTISRALRQECDDLIEIVAAQLRPYVNVLHGADTSSPPLSNGQAPSGPLSNHLHAPAVGGPRTRGHPAGHSGPQPMPSATSGQHRRNEGSPNLPPGHPSGPTYLPQHGHTSSGQPPAQSPPQDPQGPQEAQPPPEPRQHSSEFPQQDPYTPSQSFPQPQHPQYGPAPPPPGQPSGPGQQVPPHYAQPPHGQSDPHGQVPQYGQSGPHGQVPQYGQSGPHAPAPQHGQSGPHGQVPQYGQSGPHGQVPQYGQPDADEASQQSSDTPTLSDAVRAAQKEGREFGDSVARDAPALWLEAVLARKPRMPSDLEARMLQGSTLPIDFLLHDEVRNALRRGFWEALEHSRRT